MHLLKQTVTMQTEVRVNDLNCHIHVPSKHVLANREANSCQTYDVTIWLSRTTDNSNIFIRSHEVRDNESRLYTLSGRAVTLSILFLCPFKNMVYSIRKEFAPRESKFFPYRVDLFSEGTKFIENIPEVTKKLSFL